GGVGLEEIEWCGGVGEKAGVTAVMMSVNYDRLPDIARVAAAAGAPLRVNVYQPVKSDSFTLSYEQFWEGFRRLLAESFLIVCNEPLVRAFLGLDGPRCGCGVETVRLTPSGEVLPCVYWPDRSLPLSDLERLGHNIIDSQPFRQINALPEFCRTCALVETCAGGCPGRRKLAGRL